MMKSSCSKPFLLMAVVLAASLMTVVPVWGDGPLAANMARDGVDDGNKPFDSRKCNRGMVVIRKKAENITLADVRNALAIPALDKGKRLFTAEEIGLQEGDTPGVGMMNAARLKELPADCPGIKLDKMYYIFMPKGRDASNDKSKFIELDHDFVIDGEVGGKAVGGLKTNQRFFYTEHSLNLRKAHFVVEESGSFFSFIINTVNGIDQLQVLGCTFEGLGERQGRTFYLNSGDANPLDANGVPTKDNCINHIYFDGNTHRGRCLVQSGGLRVVKSCRFTGNKIYDVVSAGIHLGTSGQKKYSTTMTYMSCPIYIVGNTFQGVDRVLKTRNKWTNYHCAALVESFSVYMLHNTIRNFISGKALYTTPKGQKIEHRSAVYDLYANVTQLYYCNNHVTNLLRFTKERVNVGIFKAKGCGVPNEYAANHAPITRFYVNNVYDVDAKTALAFWKNRVYPDSGGDYSEEKAYDSSLDPNEYLTINLQSYISKLPMDTLCIRKNTIRARNIGGMVNSNNLLCAHFICDGNIFDSRNITSEEYHSKRNEGNKDDNREWLFTVRGAGENSSVQFTNNRFTAQKQAIRLLLYKYSNGRSSHARHTVIKNNTIPPSSRFVLKSLNGSKWSYSIYPVKP